MPGRTLTIGDVHGCHRALATLLDKLALTIDDTLIFVGDVVDRGPSSKQVIDEILSLRRTCKVLVIMGNHEEMMRNALAGRGLMGTWLDVGGQATLDSYGGSTDNIAPEHIRFLLTTQPYIETDTDIFIHASLEPQLSLRNQTGEYLRWKHLGGSERPHISGKRIVCGHTPQTDGIPLIFPGWVCIDTYAYGGKWLTCLDVGSNHVVQTSQLGEARDFPLSKYA